MVTLESLKSILRRKVTESLLSEPKKKPLSDAQYRDAFENLTQGEGWQIYEQFIVPQLSQLLGSLPDHQARISVLEIGPGPQSVLGFLPQRIRRKLARYTAFEPNRLFAARLRTWLSPTLSADSPFPCLIGQPDVRSAPFTSDANADGIEDCQFDVVLFCHSLYGLKPHSSYIERALRMLKSHVSTGLVVVFHREGALQLGGMICQTFKAYPSGVITVADNDEAVDQFAMFISGIDVDEIIRAEWRQVCRDMSRRDETRPGLLLFDAPEIMMVFSRDVYAFSSLASQVPVLKASRIIKNPEARQYHPAGIVRPTEVRHVQLCVQWALRHRVALTVMSGSHSGQCICPNTVCIDMGHFDYVHLTTGTTDDGKYNTAKNVNTVAVVEAGCDAGCVIRTTMQAGLTVPLGSRPSVGAGLWLQGGIGHLARLYGLTCDAILGAVIVDVRSGDVLCVGDVPSQHRPANSVCPPNQADFLWALKGAGTNFGIVISVVFQAYPAPMYSVRNWVVPLHDKVQAQAELKRFNEIAVKLPHQYAADAYLYQETNELNVGITLIEVHHSEISPEARSSVFTYLGPEKSSQVVDGVGLFDTEMYMSGMNGGHGGGKTSAFKRCVFLSNIGAEAISSVLAQSVLTRPSPLSYLHLLHAGGKVSEICSESAAFGCRSWDYACVVTGVWAREQDGSDAARAAVHWVYRVVQNLLPLSSGVYGADLGPDPRDVALASHAFGANRFRLAQLKRLFDPQNILAYACPLPRLRSGPKLVFMITGDSGVGKDHVAEIWASLLNHQGLVARVISISDATKRDYAASTGTCLERLLNDRAYKEKHRQSLSAFFRRQLSQNPDLLQEHFLAAVRGVETVDILFITGMRDIAPVSNLAPHRPDCRFFDIHIQASGKTRNYRRGFGDSDHGVRGDDTMTSGSVVFSSAIEHVYRPSFVFDNEANGRIPAEVFFRDKLLPLLDDETLKLYGMVNSIADVPRPGVLFRHVLNIAQCPNGLAICTQALISQFHCLWSEVTTIVSCETGGFVFASPLAAQVGVPLALIREAGKLPPPTISTIKSTSHISSMDGSERKTKRIELAQDLVPQDGSVVVVDDMLASGRTLSDVLQLLQTAGIKAEQVSILVVAELPAHRGRDLLRRSGFGGAHIHSLLVFDGV